MTTTMYDAVTVENIPLTAEYVAGYVGGRWVTYPVLLKRFPHAKHILSIAVGSGEDAECLDVEPGDSTPALAPAWVRRQQARGIKRPVVYGSISTMPEILRQLHAAGIDRSEVRLWAAHYDFKRHICGPDTCGWATQVDATQWRNNALGTSLDESAVSDGFWGSSAWPTPRLRLGAHGHDVHLLQHRLNLVKARWQRKLALDGVFGRATRRRVNWYKRKHGLPVDGVVGHRMGRKLIHEVNHNRKGR